MLRPSIAYVFGTDGELTLKTDAGTLRFRKQP